MALLVMVVLTAGIAAGFSATSAETITNAAHRGDNRAYNFAEAGLETYLATRKPTGLCTDTSMKSSTAGVVASGCLADPTAATVDSEWARVVLPGGYALVKSVMVRKYISDALPAIFFIRSTGVDSSVKLNGASRGVNGTRTVGMYAAWSKAVVNVQGAWLALDGLTRNGVAGTIDGNDQCGAAPTLAGAIVPGGGQFSGSTNGFSGSPALDTSQSFTTIQSGAKLDWASVLAGGIAFDFEVPQQSFPNAGWFTSNPTAWPVIRVHSNSFSLPNAGRGMIIADSDFVISGSNMWDGVVLIGGKLTSNGNNTTAGATLSGLNYLLPGAPIPNCTVLTPQYCSSDNSVANGQKTYVYNSCKVASASAGMRVYKAWNNTWLDNIPVW